MIQSQNLFQQKKPYSLSLYPANQTYPDMLGYRFSADKHQQANLTYRALFPAHTVVPSKVDHFAKSPHIDLALRPEWKPYWHFRFEQKGFPIPEFPFLEEYQHILPFGNLPEGRGLIGYKWHISFYISYLSNEWSLS